MVPSSRKARLFLFIVSFIFYLLGVRTPFDSFPSCSGAWVWLVTASAFPSLRLSLDLTVSPGGSFGESGGSKSRPQDTPLSMGRRLLLGVRAKSKRQLLQWYSRQDKAALRFSLQSCP